MLKLGLVSAATYGTSYRDRSVPRMPGSFHGTAFASTYNGYEAGSKERWTWAFSAARKQIEGAKVVKVWDPDRTWAERLAKACFIPEVCDAPEACSEGVDGVIVVDDGSGAHSQYAVHPLRAGVPTFCDKPLAMTAKGARAIAQVARETGTPFLSASSLRFVPDILALKERIGELGEVNLAMAVCGNDLVYYGVHALSMYYAVFGPGAVSCMNVGQPGRNVVRVRFEGGRDLVLIVAEREYMRAGYQIDVFGSRGWRTLQPDLADLYWYLQQAFVRMLRTGRAPVPAEEEVELIAALEAGERSLAEGREVAVSEVLAE